MSNQDFRDTLLDWLARERDCTKKLSEGQEINPAVKEYYRGRLIAYLDIIAFVMSDGRLSDTSTYRT